MFNQFLRGIFDSITRLSHHRTNVQNVYGNFQVSSSAMAQSSEQLWQPLFPTLFFIPSIRHHRNLWQSITQGPAPYFPSTQDTCDHCDLVVFLAYFVKILLFRCFFYCFSPSLSFPFLFYPFSLLSYPIHFTFKIHFPTLLFTISF